MRISGWLGTAVASAVLMLCAHIWSANRVQAASSLALHSDRASMMDLEVTGRLPGLRPGTSAFVRWDELRALPQTTATVTDDPDLPVTMHISGVLLESLGRALAADPSVDLIDALCTDGYRSYYPREMIAAHHPILVLTIDGLQPKDWAAKNHQEDPGPYLILYDHFQPAWRVLAHQDRPQLPTNAFRLNFTTQAEAFARIRPKTPTDTTTQGFRIASQNCIRCHQAGGTGGTKSAQTWAQLASDARTRPAWFAQKIRDPKSITPETQMSAEPDYDAATLAALTSYFQTFAETPAR